MDKKTRGIIFYGLCAVFVIFGAAAVLYAQGWRFDFGAFSFKKVGAIYIRSFPNDADILLNGTHIDKKSGLFDSGRFISGLFPKDYELRLTSDGYMDWTERVQVKHSLVSEVKYAVLVPKNYENVYAGTIEKFWVSGEQLILDNGDSLLLNLEKIRGNEVLWQDTGSKTAVTENLSTKTYFVNYFSENTPTSTILNQKFTDYGIRVSNVAEMVRDPGSTSAAIFRTGTKIFSLNIYSGEIAELISSSSTIAGMAASPSSIAWTTFNSKTGKSRLAFYSRSSRSSQNAVEMEGKITKLSFRNGDLGILLDDGGFYAVSPGGLTAQAGQPQKIASDVRDFVFSPSGKMAAALENNAIEIFAFNADKDYWRFRLPEIERVEKVQWYGDENHIFVIYPGEIKFLDLNDKGLENFVTVAAGSQAHYDVRSNAFYFVKGGELRKLKFPK